MTPRESRWDLLGAVAMAAAFAAIELVLDPDGWLWSWLLAGVLAALLAAVVVAVISRSRARRG